jgi:hypothetical protein
MDLVYGYDVPLRDLLNDAADRIEELEKCILIARDKFFADNSDGKAAAEMLRILNDVEILRIHGGSEWMNDTKDNREPLIELLRYKIALADAIRRPMGVIPDSAVDLVTTAELKAAEERRPKGAVLERVCATGFGNTF